MEPRFTATFPIRYQDTDIHLRASLAAVVGAMQEAAILHSEALGRGIDWLLERGWGWMIVQTRARVLAPAHWRTPLTVTSWPSEMGRLLSRREFIITDGPDGPELVRATTLWAFINTRKKRVARVPPEVAGAYPISEERALPVLFGRPAACEHPAWEQSFRIGYRDIDSNGHVNNLRYLEWMLEALPPEVPQELILREINIRFIKETLPGGPVRAQAAEVTAESGMRRFATQVLNDGGDCVSAAETLWGPVARSPATSTKADLH